MLLQPAKNMQAFAKVGLFGFQGAGKTHTSMLIALGLAERIGADKIAFFDTETGSDWWVSRMPKDVDLLVSKSRAFIDICGVIRECEENSIPILIADSVTHVWRDIVDSYLDKINEYRESRGWKKKVRMEFQDWGEVKKLWGEYTDLFINSRVHIIVCGRGGFTYEFDVNEDGTKDLLKTGTKMKAESEFGFEPSLVLEMERLDRNREELEAIVSRDKKQAFKPKIGSEWIHRCHVLKDRADKINGKVFDNPDFSVFQPHFDSLSIGGEHLGVDTSRNSRGRFDADTGDTEHKQWQRRRQIATETIRECMIKVWPGTTKEEKTCKSYILELAFDTLSWTAVENKRVEDLEPKAKAFRIFSDAYPALDLSTYASWKDAVSACWKDSLQLACEDGPQEDLNI